MAGAYTVPGVPKPSLPADTTNSAPVSSLSASIAWLTGSVPSDGPLLRLMLITSASCSIAAHSMPAITHDSAPSPNSLSTRALTSSASYATPVN